MKRISFDQLPGKTIKKAEIVLMADGSGENDLLELKFTDGSCFILNILPTPPTLEYSTAASEEADLQPGTPLERSK